MFFEDACFWMILGEYLFIGGYLATTVSSAVIRPLKDRWILTKTFQKYLLLLVGPLNNQDESKCCRVQHSAIGMFESKCLQLI